MTDLDLTKGYIQTADGQRFQVLTPTGELDNEATAQAQWAHLATSEPTADDRAAAQQEADALAAIIETRPEIVIVPAPVVGDPADAVDRTETIEYVSAPETTP